MNNEIGTFATCYDYECPCGFITVCVKDGISKYCFCERTSWG